MNLPQLTSLGEGHPTRSKALVYSGLPGQLELRELTIPEIRPNQALVRIDGCTLCGSDLHSLHGRRQVPTPTILGHEIVGTIVEMGGNFIRFDMQNAPLRPGDQVTWAITSNCGECFYCRRGLEQKCENACKYGHMGFDSGYALSGGLAEHCVLAAGTRVVRVPDGVSLEVICPSSCATATVMAAMSKLTADASFENSHIVIVGAGMLGLTACAIASHRGWQKVVVVDPILSKRELARRFGATHCYSPEEWLSDRVRNDKYGCDVVLELSGVQAMMEPALESLRIGGQLILVGAVFPVSPISVLPEQLIRRQITLQGIHNYRPEHLLEAVMFLAQHGQSFPFAELVSSWHNLDELESMINNGLSSALVRIGVKPFQSSK